MVYKKIQKSICLIFSIMLCVLTLTVLSSCEKNNDKEKPICEITFVSNGVTKTVHSTVTPLFGVWEKATADEFDNAPNNCKFSEQTSPEICQAMKDVFVHINLTKNNSKPTAVGKLNETHKNKKIYLYYWDYNQPYAPSQPQNIDAYKKSTFIGFQYDYVYVDVIDNQTISIKSWEGTTVYTVSSYKITYFDDIK